MKGKWGLGVLLCVAGAAQAASYQCELRGHIANVSLDQGTHTLTVKNEWSTTSGLVVVHSRNDSDYDDYALGSIYGPALSINRKRADDVQFSYCMGCEPYVCRAE